MNPFQRHVQEHLSGKSNKPDWIKAAQRKFARRVTRYAKQHNVTNAEAKAELRRQQDE